jgi:MFS family permease
MGADENDFTHVDHVDTLDVEDKQVHLEIKGLDEAQKYVGDGDFDIDVSPEEMKKLVRKIDLVVLPFIAVCYVFFYVDKTTLSYAAIFGIKTDLGLKGTEYSWLSSIFYFGYLVWSFPTNYLLLKFPVAKYLGTNIFLWGVFLMIQAACPSFATLCVVRALGGAAEACADPAFMLITSMWYTRREQPVRIGLWYAANGLGIACGGLLGTGIGSIKSSIPSWKLEFIIIGALCAIWGIVVFLFLPDSPVHNRYFTDREKRIIVLRLKENQTGIETKTFKWSQVKDLVIDPKTWAFMLVTMFCNIPNGGLSNFQTQIVKSFGFNNLQTSLLQIPYGAIISISILVAVYLNNLARTKNMRCFWVVIFMLPNIAGAFGLEFLPSSNKAGRLICYYLTGPYNASFVLILSLVTSNTAGHTKKVMTNAITFLGYCVGNIAGPFFYKTDQAPRYPLGIGSLLFSHFFEIIISVFLAIYMSWENRRRDRKYPNAVHHSFDDVTDISNKAFRYVY